MLDIWTALRRQVAPCLLMPLAGLMIGVCLLALASWRSSYEIERETQQQTERLDLLASVAQAELRALLEDVDGELQRLRRASLRSGQLDVEALGTAIARERGTLAKLGIAGVVAVDREARPIGRVDGRGPRVDLDALRPGLARLSARGEQHVLIGDPVLSRDAHVVLPVLLPATWNTDGLGAAIVAFVRRDALANLTGIKTAPGEIAFGLHGLETGLSVDLRPDRSVPFDAVRLALEHRKTMQGHYEENPDGAHAVLVSHRAIQNFELLLTARLDLTQSLEGTRAASRVVLILAVLVGLFLQFATVQLVHYVDALHAAHATLRETEDKERRRAHELDATLDAMIQGAMVVDPDRRITVVNSVFAELAKLPADWLPHLARFDELLERLLQRGDFGRATGIDDLPPALSGRGLGPDDERHELVRADGMVLDVRTKRLGDGGFIITLTDITEHRRSIQRIRKLAEEDPLTELANRRQFYESLRAELPSVYSGQSAVLLLDLDRFKQVNDTLGHPIGDKLLQEVARRITATARNDDLVARLGGDEFAVLQRGIQVREHAEQLAARLLERVAAPYLIDGHEVEVGTSVGIALMPDDGREPEQIMKAADVALYHAKTCGRGSAHFFAAAMQDALTSKRAIESDLKRAIAERQFEVHYQPIHDIATRRLIGFEALCRWRHPERGLIPPADFIPFAEESGLITEIGIQIIDAAIADAGLWPSHLTVAINLSPVQLKSPSLLTKILETLAQHGVAGSRVELEVTEAVILEDDDVIIANLGALDAAGIRLAMDDFGTGYSSLSYLRRFPFHKVKIDRSFVRSINRSSECQAIVEAATLLARRLGLVATAEGIETAEELEIVRSLGCDQGQGYLLGRPMAASDAHTLATRSAAA